METFHQKIIRNLQGKFLAYKTTEVVGDKANIANLEWSNPEDVDGFFAFATQLGTKIMYYAEGELVDEDENTSNTSILQIGFIYNGVMHHMNDADDEDEDDGLDEEDDLDESDYDEEDDYENGESDGSNQENNDVEEYDIDEDSSEESIDQESNSGKEQNIPHQTGQF